MPPRPLRTRDNQEVAFRYIACSDGPALQAFNAGLSEKTRARFLPHAYDDETVRKVLGRTEEGTDYAVVLLHENTIIGYAFLWNMKEPVPVLGIGITDAWQGEGLGEPLMQHLIDTAETEGRDGLILTTVPENERAFALYQKMGFLHTGDTENVAGDGRTVREFVMFLPLTPGAKPPAHDFRPPV